MKVGDDVLIIGHSNNLGLLKDARATITDVIAMADKRNMYEIRVGKYVLPYYKEEKDLQLIQTCKV